jgi:hypothetical protein
MAESNPVEPDWFKEFKKATAPAPPEAPSAGAPAGPSLSSPTTERRKHIRFEVEEAAARFHRKGITAFIGLSKLSLEGTVMDLSEGGVRLLTDERILIGTKVHVQISIARFQDLIESDAEARWCRQDPKKENEFQVGIMFTGLEPSQARKFAVMREYFTSTQYKALHDARVREQKTSFRFPK